MEKTEDKPTEPRVYKLVLTGGPCGGKTTGQSRISTFFENLGWKVFRVPETATVLLSGGIKFSDLNEEEAGQSKEVGEQTLCNHCVPVACEESEAFTFQENLLKTMIQIEDTYFELARSCTRNCLIICDRGAMDASAFISKEKWEKLLKNNGWNNVGLRDNRYDQIIHMVTAANGAEEYYTIEDHACRSEGVELAKKLDYNAAAAWVGHPYFDVIDNSTNFEGKIRRMIGAVCHKLGIDTGDRLTKNSRKLKFLIRGPLPAEAEFPDFKDFEVTHNYLQSTSYNQVRLRKRGEKGNFTYTYTIRRSHKLGEVIEVKTQITHRDYINLLSQKDNSHFTIYKKRRCFLVNNQYFQLDIYQEPGHPRCKGLMLLETYSALDEKSLSSCLPKFLTIVKEVTGNPDYSMFNLSLREDWKTSKKFCYSLKGPEESQNSTIKTNGVQSNGVHTNGINKIPINGKV